MLRFLILGAGLAVARGSAVELGEASFDSVVLKGGKNAIVKFFAPWCGHCKAMKPAWEQLGAEFAGSSAVVVGDVDCDAEANKALCERLEIQGFPTIKYYTAETGDAGADYNDARDFESLKTFVADRLAEKCLVAEPASCSDKEAGFIAKMRGKGGTAELVAEQARLEGLKATPMAPELKKWLSQRLAILAQLVSTD